MTLSIVPCTIGEAQAYVNAFHRHHKAPVGALFAIGLSAELAIEVGVDIFAQPVMCGVAIVGRPVARALDDQWTVEITRVCTNGVPNGCSMLYAACRRAALAMGYKRLITYTLASEAGASLRGAGFRVVADVRGRSWSAPSRPRVDKAPHQDKLRWESI